ncbi:MAG: chemotaxis protein CheR [Candidatus Margulisiibacteriota bacterium]|nr:MAG: chemotaxis protein CheR [Candidatus Margulisbacteria bacterium GWD2_39_127]PZM79752.1 MAG: chemotaxis protein CheR [Candidatus Margulisiibacteriota bacterium]HAR62147.1 chemotaxis protein CheR [Candidatus Margulisiibacteriota bacterium]HCT85130.1 chemotaxis protein CheR [Candidatus Margulisiibacteriota bacterium]HCY36704.1 chemotaxis protein CheR [Candidatus Margulisiibacteriota bacterium]
MDQPNNEALSILTRISISDQEYHEITALIYDRFGIILSEEKRSMVMGRLQKYMRTNGYSSYSQYIDHLKSNNGYQALSSLIDNISTNYTFFYRENDHFDYFSRTVLPELTGRLAVRDKDIRMWCAACSTGEEAYTIMFCLMEHLGSAYGQWNSGLLATDISEKVLKIAQTGKYTSEQIEKVPLAIRNKYLKLKEPKIWEVTDKLKEEITFRRFNLMNRDFPFKKQFQVIFCRNVMIYFDQPTREKLVKNFSDFLVPGGYLFIGHSESLRRTQDNLKYVMPSVYRKK